ncbi:MULTISPECIES: MFS transporter [unclassified Paenibacillus]|uniref:MFS transporter n=1 Tax=unclassified Paenibacillus TaxID=185978 RepID=UPI0036C68477
MRTLSSYYFLYYLAMSVLMPYTSLYFSERGFSFTAVGLILSLWALVSVVAQPVMGLINDRLGNPKQIMLLSSILAAVLGFGFNLMEGLTGIIVLSLFFAWFQSSVGPVGDALAVEIASRDGFSFGNVRLFGALSYAIGTFTTGILYERFGYSHIFVYYLVISMIVCVTILFLPTTKVSRRKVTLFGQMGEVVRNKPFMIFVVTSTLMMMSASINLNFLPLYFKEMGFNKSWIGSAFAIAAIIEVPMFWVATRLSKAIGRYPLLCLAAAIYGSQYLVMFLFSNVSLTLAVQLLNGVAFAFAAGTAVEVVQSYATEGTKATLQTVYAAVTWGLGGIVGNAVGGVVTDHLGAKFLYLILFCLCAAASLLFIVNRHHQPSVNQELAG